MLRNLIILPDGTELFSGKGTKNAIMSVTATECVNSGEELTLGSVCAGMLEATLWTPGGGLSLKAGEELTLYKVDDTGTRYKVGLFSLEKPTRPSTNTLKITGYDRVTRLDKDLTAWLKGLEGWPYTLTAFARMVCEACGVTLKEQTLPNGDMPLHKFFQTEVTGRKLMGWIGEACCRFLRADAEGILEFAWFTPSGVTLGPSGKDYYYAGGLQYEDYRVAPIEAVQLRLADSENGYLWPEAAEGANSYIVSGNPFFTAVRADTEACLNTILAELSGLSYTPCRVSFPARMDVRAGHTVQITDRNGASITVCVMTRTQKGQRDTVECTGSARRDSTTAQNSSPSGDKLTQGELFEILTNGGEIEGLFMKDGKLYVNASYIRSGELYGLTVRAGKIVSEDETICIDLSGEAGEPVFNTGIRTNGLTVCGAGESTMKLFRLEALPYILNSETLGYQGRLLFKGANGDQLYSLYEQVGLNAAMDAIETHGISQSFQSEDGICNVELEALNEGARFVFHTAQADGSIRGGIAMTPEGTTELTIHRINGREVEWKDNGDGTHTLIGK